MRFSRAFLKSRVARGIALLLLTAAMVPASLITSLSRHETIKLVSSYEHKTLVDTSQAYALATFSNLTVASEKLSQFSQLLRAGDSDDIELLRLPMFLSIVHLRPDGEILQQYGESGLAMPSKALIRNANLGKQSGNPRLVVLPMSTTGHYALYLTLPDIKAQRLESLLVAKLNPEFVWGSKDIYPDNTNLCVYRQDGKKTPPLFCSHDVVATSQSTNAADINTGSWELFLRGVFGETSWRYETQRRQPISADMFSSMTGNSYFIWIAVLTLLLVGLLSLMQIRKTLVPLEHLIEATKKVSKGNFSPVKIVGNSEFSDLANAFNTMSTHIEKQLGTLQSLSELDREIVTKLDVQAIISQVMSRMHKLQPLATFCIFRLDSEDNAVMQCTVDIGGATTLDSTRISVPLAEIAEIKSYGQGQASECSTHSRLAHQSLPAQLGNKFNWTLPIFWQDEMYAFLTVSSNTPLDTNDTGWNEFRELAGRIGIAISAHAREAQLLTQAQYDALTGLPNRILLHDRLCQAIEHSDRVSNPFWTIFLDLDHFKYVNDSMGHEAGDQLLMEISKRLHACIRETDTVARFGGDEFVIILQGGMDENQKLGIVNRMIASIAMPIQVNQQEISITSSLGISVYPSDGLTAEVLVKHADIAMYRAKESGRNNFQFFTQSMNEKAAKRMHMESLLRRALERNEFTLLYQPQVDLVSRDIAGVEALIRWNNPELGEVYPAEFIRLAEEIGLIIPIGEWVLRKACQQAVCWQKAGFGTLKMSVNLSVRQFRNENLLESIQDILTETGMPAEYLELELTESMFVNDRTSVLKTMHGIKAMGIRLAIDDFGTGYSSLSYVDNLPLDTLKIDKSFTDDIKQGKQKSPVVDTIITLAKNLGLKIVAEGVEYAEQADYLTARGCDLIQGYYYSKPKPASVVEEMLTFNKKLSATNLETVKTSKNITPSNV